MKNKTAVRWGVAGLCGLYVGQEQTRREAIRRHVQAYESEWLDDEAIKRKWSERRRKGDRAVKLKIAYLDPGPKS